MSFVNQHHWFVVLVDDIVVWVRAVFLLDVVDLVTDTFRHLPYGSNDEKGAFPSATSERPYTAPKCPCCTEQGSEPDGI